jgi:PAS domain S-box-containing protein
MSFQVLLNEATVMALLNAFPDVAFLMNVEGDYLAVNAALAQRLGQKVDELVGRCAYDLLPPDLAETRKAQVKDVIRTGRPMRFQDQRDGLHLDNLLHPIFDAQGKVVALAVFSHDATERVRAEETLRKREERYRVISELTSDFAYALGVGPDRDLTPEWIVGAYTRITGFTPAESLAHGNWESLVHPDDLFTARRHLSTQISGQPDVCEYRIITKSGEVRWLRDYGRPAWDEAQSRVVRIYGAAQDVTQRRQAEQELNQYRDHLQELVQERTAELHREISERVRAEKSLRESERALRRRNSELALLNLAGQVFSSTLDMDWILSTVLEAVRHLMNVAICSIWLRDVESDELVCQQAAGPQSEILRGWRLAPGVGLAGWTVRHGESVVVPDAQNDERHFGGVEQQTGLELHSLLSVPMRVKEDVIGVLQAADEKSARFDAKDLELLEPLAASAAIAVENARLYRQARQEIAERMRAEQALRRERDFA